MTDLRCTCDLGTHKFCPFCQAILRKLRAPRRADWPDDDESISERCNRLSNEYEASHWREDLK